MTAEPSERTIILGLLRSAVPERGDEICRLWADYGHSIEVSPDAKGVTVNADANRIHFDMKTIDLFWLLGFSGCGARRIPEIRWLG